MALAMSQPSVSFPTALRNVHHAAVSACATSGAMTVIAIVTRT
jgi:hypothetical protein